MSKANYAIMRISKLSKNNDFARVLNHNNRNYENTPGVDRDKEHLNISTGITEYDSIKVVLEHTNSQIEKSSGKKVAKNRVRGFELLFAVNQDFMSNELKRDEYFKLAHEWCNETFGSNNFVGSNIHMDESGSPHCHVTVLCRDFEANDGVANYQANKWVSNRMSLTALQDSWHGKVAHLGLERGQSAKYTHEYHKTKQEYVKLLEKDLEKVNALPQHEKDLLAVKGLRAVQKERDIVQGMKTRQNEMQGKLQRNIEVIRDADFENDFEL